MGDPKVENIATLFRSNPNSVMNPLAIAIPAIE
jgi:hypothetical protein